jgi:hypothetical protein
MTASKYPAFNNGKIRLSRAQNINLTLVALNSTNASEVPT